MILNKDDTLLYVLIVELTYGNLVVYKMDSQTGEILVKVQFQYDSVDSDMFILNEAKGEIYLQLYDNDNTYLSVLDMHTLEQKVTLDFNEDYNHIAYAKLVGQELIFERVDYDPSGSYDTFGFVSIHTSMLDGRDILIDGSTIMYEQATYNRWDPLDNAFDPTIEVIAVEAKS